MNDLEKAIKIMNTIENAGLEFNPDTVKVDYKAAQASITKSKLPFYKLRSILGYDWAIYYYLLGGRMAGKSYAVLDFFLSQWKEHNRIFYWLRLTEGSTRKLLKNNAEKLIDPDLRRRYGLDIEVRGENVYSVKYNEKGTVIKNSRKLICKVLSLSTFYSDKGNGFFDKDYIKQPDAYYNICLDEMNREANEKNTFDIVYAFANEVENLVRNTKHNIRIICIGNTLQEASDLLVAVNFLPDKFGRYKLVKNKKLLQQMINEYKHAKTDHDMQAIHEKYKDVDFGKRAVIEYMEPTESYRAMRNGSAAEILSGNSSTFTNEVEIDLSLINHTRRQKVTSIIKFSKDKSKWFTVWDGHVISSYGGQTAPVIAMRPYLDEYFNADIQKTYINLFDTRSMLFKDLSTFKKYQAQIQLLKPRK